MHEPDASAICISQVLYDNEFSTYVKDLRSDPAN